MSLLSGLPRLGVAIHLHRAARSRGSVCVFCLHDTRLPFSTSTFLAIDAKREHRKAQTARQRRYEEKNAIGLTSEQLAPRLRHQEQVEFKQAVKLAKRRGTEVPEWNQWKVQKRKKEEFGMKLEEVEEMAKGAEEKELEQNELEEWQQSVDEALHEVIKPRPTTWDGMEMVGGETEWDTGLKFEGQLSGTKLSSRNEITAAMYQAIVEVLTALAQGQNMASIPVPTRPIGLYSEAAEARITLENPDASATEASSVKLEYPNAEVENQICMAVSPPDINEAEEAFEDERFPNEAEATKEPEFTQEHERALKALSQKYKASLPDYIESWGTDWLSISIADPTLKLALIKRLHPALGKTIPDLLLHKQQTVGALLNAIVRPPPAKKLHESLTSNDSLLALPNLSLHGKRDGPVERETGIGRWKVIRRELRRRGLPVLDGISGWEHEQRAAEEAKHVRKQEVDVARDSKVEGADMQFPRLL